MCLFVEVCACVICSCWFLFALESKRSKVIESGAVTVFVSDKFRQKEMQGLRVCISAEGRSWDGLWREKCDDIGVSDVHDWTPGQQTVLWHPV